MRHVMFANARHHALCHDHIRREAFGNVACHNVDASPIVLHGKMLQVLFNGGDRNDAGLQFSSLHAFGEFSPCHVSQKIFGHVRLVLIQSRC